MISFREYCAQPDFGCDREMREMYATWLVTPFARHRDSDCLQESNHHVAVRRMGGEGDDVAVLRFGHWAVGWVEQVLVRPGSAAAVCAELMIINLENYPVLDEDDFSAREADCHERA